MRLPDRCPSCSATLRVTNLTCPACATHIQGEFSLCPVCSLEEEDRTLLELYLSVRGNAKQVERSLKLSYPTVRARLEQLWGRLKFEPPKGRDKEFGPIMEPGEKDLVPLGVMRRLREGQITVDQAEQILQGGDQSIV